MANFYVDKKFNSRKLAERDSQLYLKDYLILQDLKYKEDWTFYKVDIDLRGFILTFEAGFQNTPILVMVHGFGGSIAFFGKMFKELSKTFHIYAFDMYGMGNSYRYKFKMNTWDECMDLYTLSFEQWRKKLELEDFFWLGYSLGGYISLHYINRYRPKLRGIYIVSSPGFVSVDFAGKEYVDSKIGAALNQGSWLMRTAMNKVYQGIEKNKMNPYKYMHMLPSKKLFKEYVKEPIFKLTKGEIDSLTNYHENMIRLRPSGEEVIGYFIQGLSYSDHPTSDFFLELSEIYQFCFMYGENDWQDIEPMKRKILEFPKDRQFDINILADCGHMNLMEQPQHVNKVILDNYEIFEQINLYNNRPEPTLFRTMTNTAVCFGLSTADKKSKKARVWSVDKLADEFNYKDLNVSMIPDKSESKLLGSEVFDEGGKSPSFCPSPVPLCANNLVSEQKNPQRLFSTFNNDNPQQHSSHVIVANEPIKKIRTMSFQAEDLELRKSIMGNIGLGHSYLRNEFESLKRVTKKLEMGNHDVKVEVKGMMDSGQLELIKTRESYKDSVDFESGDMQGTRDRNYTCYNDIGEGFFEKYKLLDKSYSFEGDGKNDAKV